VTDVTLRDPSQWRLIGKPMERIDIVGKSTGTLDYGIDLTVEGMVHAAIRVNPRKGGTLNSYDATARREMRGVRTSSRSRAACRHRRQHVARLPGARRDHI
jgi:isoquinoline 1-oxidoreductase beta subunit